MKKLFLISAIIFLFATQGYSSVTTIDGAITLDFYEDTQFGNNRWILDMKVNDYAGSGGGSVNFDLNIFNNGMFFDNQYNVLDTDYYKIASSTVLGPDGILYPTLALHIYTDSTDLPTPEGTMFRFYALPTQEGEPIIGTFNLLLGWGSSHNPETQNFQLTGPIGFAVPEPAGMCLFALGAFFLKFLIKRK